MIIRPPPVVLRRPPKGAMPGASSRTDPACARTLIGTGTPHGGRSYCPNPRTRKSTKCAGKEPIRDPHQECCTHCHFRFKVSFLDTPAHTVPPPWRKKESFPRDSRPFSFARKEVTHGPLRCADVPLYGSVVDSHAHGLSFPPTLVVVGALTFKRWIVQNGSSSKTDWNKYVIGRSTVST